MFDVRLASERSDAANGNCEATPLSVCLVTMGTYPHYTGGVSAWCDLLVRGLGDVRFTLVSMVADPGATPHYELPDNVVELITVPLWGTGEVLELQRNLSLRQVLRRKQSAPATAIASFLPSWRRFLQTLWEDRTPPAKVVTTLQEMAAYFAGHDYDATMRSRLVWDMFLETARHGYPHLLDELGLPADTVSLFDATNAMRLLYRWLAVLTVTIPRVDVVHAAAAGLCSIPGIIAHRTHNTPFLLTEHGIYLRERLLALTRAETSLFDLVFQSRFDMRITEASYHCADRIAPGSNYNHRWELRNGASANRIQTIYNGPDPDGFTPGPFRRALQTQSTEQGPSPTIVWLGRIDPLKDLHTLIRAAALVHKELPQARFVLYGKTPKGNEDYYAGCLALRDALDLEQTVTFAGFADSAEAAYNEGDIVVLSSISEGFPYSVVEAMMCARPVVGTAVGGVPEALEGCGLVVEPRNPEALAQACLYLLQNPTIARELGQEGREKALTQFSLQQCNSAYLSTYRQLAGGPYRRRGTAPTYTQEAAI